MTSPNLKQVGQFKCPAGLQVGETSYWQMSSSYPKVQMRESQTKTRTHVHSSDGSQMAVF